MLFSNICFYLPVYLEDFGHSKSHLSNPCSVKRSLFVRLRSTKASKYSHSSSRPFLTRNSCFDHLYVDLMTISIFKHSSKNVKKTFFLYLNYKNKKNTNLNILKYPFVLTLAIQQHSLLFISYLFLYYQLYILMSDVCIVPLYFWKTKNGLS